MSNQSFKIKNSSVHVPIDLTTLVSPEAGEIACDINDGNKLKRYDSISATWTELGSGAGGINYISDNSDFEAGVAGYSTYADAAGAAPVDGTGGVANITFAASAVSPLRGTKSGLLTKDAANRQGQGDSYDFTIDPADRAQILRISFDYESSVNYVDGDLRVYVYDVTNSRLIEVVDRDLYASSFGKYTGTFQTSSDSTSYRLIWHVASTNASAWTVKLDNVVVGPQNLIKGLVGFDSQTTTVSSLITGATTNPTFGTLGTNLFSYSRRGENLVFNGALVQSTAGTIGSGTYFINLPDGLIVDSAKISSSNSGAMGVCGSCIFWDGASYYTGSVTVNYSVDSRLELWFGDETSAPTRWGSSNYPFSLTNLRFSFYGEVPILGWSSNMTLSEDAGNREIAFYSKLLGAATHTSSGSYQKVALTSSDIVNDTSSGWNTVNNRWVAPESGFYDLVGNVLFSTVLSTATAITVGVAIGINGLLTTRCTSLGGMAVTSTITRYLNKGDYVELFGFQSESASETYSTVVGVNYLTIAKRSSPQTVAASEIVACRYRSNSGAVLGALATYVFEDLVYDTHNAYNSSTGQFTVPQTGYYSICTSINTASFVLSTTSALALRVYVDGSHLSGNAINGNGANNVWQVTVSTSLYLVKGSIVDIRAASAATTAGTASAFNYIDIVKLNGVS